MSYKNVCAALLCARYVSFAADASAETYLPEHTLRPIQLRQHALKRCYGELLKRLPTAQGSLELTFIVKPGGRVSELLIPADTVIPEEAAAERVGFEGCIRAALSNLVLPNEGVEDITFTQRLRFIP